MNENKQPSLSGWLKKKENLEKINRDVLPGLVQWSHDTVRNDIDKFVSGPHYGPDEDYRGEQTGGIPIPRISGRLAGSIETMRLSDVFIIIRSNHQEAPHNWYVHDGTDKMAPRPFIKYPVDQNRPIIKAKQSLAIYSYIRDIGRKPGKAI